MINTIGKMPGLEVQPAALARPSVTQLTSLDATWMRFSFGRLLLAELCLLLRDQFVRTGGQLGTASTEQQISPPAAQPPCSNAIKIVLTGSNAPEITIASPGQRVVGSISKVIA